MYRELMDLNIIYASGRFNQHMYYSIKFDYQNKSKDRPEE